ncbi:MAG TPA: histidine kinase [Clostridia bacterium]|nr:histidine kinase [Clostridia bacterium]
MRFSKLRAFWGSICTQSLAYFIAVISSLLVVFGAFTYKAVSDVIIEINGEASASELAQIGIYISGIHDDLTRQSDALISTAYAERLGFAGAGQPLGEIYDIRSLYAEVSSIILNFPYIHSVYFFEKDGDALYLTDWNTQRFAGLDWSAYPRLSEQLSKCTSKGIHYLSGLTADDFPYNMGTKRGGDGRKLVTAVRTMLRYRLVINVYEDQFQRSYTGASSKPSHQVRIMGPDGTVLSSLAKDELGKPYAGLSAATPDAAGQYEDAGAQKQVTWMRLPSAGLLVTSEVMLADYWSNLTRIVRVLLLIIVPGFFTVCLMFYLWFKWTFRPLGRLQESMALVGRDQDAGPLPVRGADELSRLVGHYNDMLEKLHALRLQNALAEREKRESDLRALRNQINPHFLFNTLTTIRWMCAMEGNRNAADCIASLCSIIGPMFKSDEPTWTLREELETVDSYVYIMNTRLGGVIEYHKAVDEALADASVLRFVLQPLVENAIEHGFDASGGKGRIVLSISREGADMLVRVSNNGQSLSEEELTRLNESIRTGQRIRGIGLINTHRRIALRFGPGRGVWMESNRDGPGISTLMRMPAHADESC